MVSTGDLRLLDGVFGIGVFLFLFYGPWQAICTDFARDHIFDYRDQLFDMAARGELDFESTEYKNIRDWMNGAIRMAHYFSVPRFFSIYFMMRGTPEGAPEALGNALSRDIRDPEIRAKVNRLLLASEWELVKLLIRRSIIFAPFYYTIKLCRFFGLQSKVLKIGPRAFLPFEKVVGFEVRHCL